jgi:hypothetical protein
VGAQCNKSSGLQIYHRFHNGVELKVELGTTTPDNN